MKLTLLCVGRIRDPNLRPLFDDYVSRIRRYLPIERVETRDRSRSSPNPATAREREGRDLLAQLSSSGRVVAMEAGGRLRSSEELASWLGSLRDSGVRQLTLVIGGPWGLSDAVREHCNEKLSLSPMTLPHELAQVVLAEQLYRSLTILKGHPYHH